jgi:hypothetical protein
MKKLFLLLFPALLLLLSLSLGQIALAADEACTNETTATPPGIGGTCETISACPTTQGTPPKAFTDTAYFTSAKKTACIDEYKGSTKDCFKSKCDGVWNRVCCKPKSAGDTTPPADGGTTGGGGGKTVSFKPDELSPIGNPSVPELIGLLVKGALGIVGSIALLMFVYGGFIMMISQGDATKITKGKTILVWSAIGIMIIFGSYIFVSYIITELGQGQGGGGGTTKECGKGTLTGYSCMDYRLGTPCEKGLCPGGADNQCCKPKP